MEREFFMVSVGEPMLNLLMPLIEVVIGEVLRSSPLAREFGFGGTLKRGIDELVCDVRFWTSSIS